MSHVARAAEKETCCLASQSKLISFVFVCCIISSINQINFTLIILSHTHKNPAIWLPSPLFNSISPHYRTILLILTIPTLELSLTTSKTLKNRLLPQRRSIFIIIQNLKFLSYLAKRKIVGFAPQSNNSQTRKFMTKQCRAPSSNDRNPKQINNPFVENQIRKTLLLQCRMRPPKLALLPPRQKPLPPRVKACSSLLQIFVCYYSYIYISELWLLSPHFQLDLPPPPRALRVGSRKVFYLLAVFHFR